MPTLKNLSGTVVFRIFEPVGSRSGTESHQFKNGHNT